MELGEIQRLTAIDPWFLHNIAQLVEFSVALEELKPFGTAQEQPGQAGPGPSHARPSSGDFPTVSWPRPWAWARWPCAPAARNWVVTHTYKLVDTCAAEFEAYTPYFYSTYETEDECRAGDRKKVMILGGGPNRIGQGIEFDYCCVHASFALREMGVESIMVNSNPETVSTDYDTSDKLYFEPLTQEDVLNIIESEKPYGIIVQFGGQTPLNLAVPPGKGRRAHPGHPARRHRPGRGPRPLLRPAQEAGPAPAGQRHRHHRGSGLRHRRPHRLSGGGPAPPTCWAAGPWRSSTTGTPWCAT